MKMIFFSQHFYPENFRINDIAFGLSKKYKISVFTGRPNYHTGKIPKKYKGLSLKHEKIKDIDIFRFPIFPRGKGYLQRIINYLSYILSGSFYSIINKKITTKSRIFIYATSPFFQVIPGIIFSKLQNTKSCIWIQDLWPETLLDLKIIKKGIVFKLLNRFVNILYSFTDLILVPSEGLKKNLKSKVKNVPVKVYHNPSNLNFQKKIKKNRNKKIVITFSGNIGNAQDFNSLTIALNKNLVKKNIIFKFIGNGEHLNTLKKKLKPYVIQRKVIFKNYMEQKKLNQILLKSDAYFITLKKGISFDLIIPGKFSTYLSFGKPILANCRGDLSKIIEKNEVGYVSQQNDYIKLAENINKISRLNNTEKIKIFKNCKKLFSNLFELKNNLVILEKYLKFKI